MFRLGRLIPRTVAQVVADGSGEALSLQRILVVDAIDVERSQGSDATVGSVAAHLGVDPSTASRLVAEAVRSGSVQRVASQQDGRRVHLRLTDRGEELLAGSRRFQQAVFERLTQQWSERDKHQLARLMIKLLDANGLDQVEALQHSVLEARAEGVSGEGSA
jgi:DNA-binding MarR family transcriptional regulator